MNQPKSPTPAVDSKAIAAPAKRDESRSAHLARHMTSPATTAAVTSSYFIEGTVKSVELPELLTVLQDKVAQVQKGDLSDLEATLAAQATTLNSIFSEMARRGALNMGVEVESCDRYMRLALKAQSQCRATIETLAAIKSPPVVIARQANFSAGHQQINNGDTILPPAENSQTAQIKVLDANHGQRLDTRTTSTAIGADTDMAPMGKRDRPANGRRKSARVSKRGQGEDA